MGFPTSSVFAILLTCCSASGIQGREVTIAPLCARRLIFRERYPEVFTTELEAHRGYGR